VVKQIFKIDLNGAVDVTGMDGTTAATHAVTKSLTPFLDVVQLLTANGIPADHIPAKLEGIGPDVKARQNNTPHLWVANDNDFPQRSPRRHR
jgi:hypothetical protein